MPVQSSWGAIRPYRARIVFGCAVLIVATSLGTILPYVLGLAVDATLSGGHVVRLAGVILALAIVQAMARSVGNITLYGTARKAEHDLRMATFSHLAYADAAMLREYQTGDLVARMTADLQTMMWMWGHGISVAFGIACLFLFSMIAMIVIDPILTLWAFGPIPIVIIATRYLTARVKQRNAEANSMRGQLSSAVHEDVSGIGAIRNYQAEPQRTKKFGELSQQLTRGSLGAQFVAGLYGPLTATFVAIGTAAVLWRGGIAVTDGRLRLGSLVQFNGYLIQLSGRVVMLASVMPLFQQGEAAWQRITKLLSRAPTIVDGSGPPLPTEVKGHVEMRGLTIEVEGTKLLDGLSFDVRPGTFTAIVGRVGAGKTTLVQAIPRLLDVGPGQLFIEDRDITDLPLASLRGSIAYAPQHAQLLSASIADNIAFGIDGSPESVRARVLAAAATAGLEPDLAGLPEGIDTQVGERGVMLSGGQRQRVALARAIASDRPILLLDDSLSAVDTKTERRIIDKLIDTARGRTVIMVSHRVTVTTRAHEIAVLDNGRLVEHGTHDDLSARNGVYAELYRAQIEEEAAA
ncbi:ABC transporter ATP-binding protein [soil metagenome]